MVQAIELDAIRLDDSLQPRVKIDCVAVKEYGEAMTGGARLPAVVVYFDGIDYWLADGFHRYHAHRQIGMLKIDADVHDGSRRDAVLYSVGANANQFALRRTHADKRRAVQRMLADDQWVKWSDNDIAKHCAVSQPFVGSVRSSLTTVIGEKPSERTYTTKHGTQATMRTAGIGRKAKSVPSATTRQSTPTTASDQPCPFPTPVIDPATGAEQSVALGEDTAPAGTSSPSNVPAAHASIAIPGVGSSGPAAKPESDNRKEIDRLKGEVAKLERRVRKQDERIKKLKADLYLKDQEIGALKRGHERRRREGNASSMNEVMPEPSRSASA